MMCLRDSKKYFFQYQSAASQNREDDEASSSGTYKILQMQEQNPENGCLSIAMHHDKS